ncbi:MAG: SCO family protein [Bacteroidetes bacterium HGW-Bacteroidetes-16]|jgi:protein SCO1/2|nr:MAG: SCO family protein [Bacteroidetes bacterium HGW-Bacteroidetes-16]
MNLLRGTARAITVVIISLIATIGPIHAQEELGVYEHLDDTISDDLIFTDELFNQVNLKDAINKPTIISLVYYECPGICSPLLNGLAEALEKTDITMGKDYQVFTISFNQVEKPPLALKKKKTYAKLVTHGDTENGWHFFTGDSANIYRLLNEVGFKVKKEGTQFIHPGTLIVLSPKGKITRYLYGSAYFLPFDIKMAVAEAAQGRSGPTITKMLNYCFSYDPAGKKYVFNVTKISGILILLIALIFLASLSLKSRKSKKTDQIS